MAKEIEIQGKKVKFYSGYESADFPKWLLNKIHGNVVKQSEWMSERISDYKLLQKMERDYYLVGILPEKPEGGKICCSGFSFIGYLLEVEYRDYSSQLKGKAIAIVPRHNR